MLLRPASARVPRPPGPSSASLLTAVALGGQHLTTFFDRAARRHPRIAHLRLGPEHVYLLNSPDLVHEVLVRQARSTMKGRAIQATRQLLGNGLLTSEGEAHRTSRRLLQPAFSSRRITSYAEDMRTLTLELSDAWARGSGTVDMSAQMSTLTLQIVGRALVRPRPAPGKQRGIDRTRPGHGLVSTRGASRRSGAFPAAAAVVTTSVRGSRSPRCRRTANHRRKTSDVHCRCTT